MVGLAKRGGWGLGSQRKRLQRDKEWENLERALKSLGEKREMKMEEIKKQGEKRGRNGGETAKRQS